MSTRTFTFTVTAPPPSGIPAHISNAPVGEWAAIGSNTMASVAYNYSSWPIAGFNTNLQAIMNAWGGAAYDPLTHRLFVHGGGHNDYDGNETYAFNLSTNTWKRLDNPSPYDEDTTIPVNGVFPDNGPQPIHTYEIMSVNPNTGKLYYLGRSGSLHTKVREFDPVLATQQTPGTFRSAWAYKATMPWSDPASGASAWMQDEGKFLVAYHDQGGWIHVSRYDPAADTAGAVYATGLAHTGDKAMAYSPSRRLALIHRTSASSNTLIRFNAASNTATAQVVTGATLPSVVGLEYDSVRDRFIAYDDRVADRRVLFSINPDTWVATQISPTGVTPSLPNTWGVFGRFAYCSDYDVFLMVNQTGGSVYIYKPVGWSPPA